MATPPFPGGPGTAGSSIVDTDNLPVGWSRDTVHSHPRQPEAAVNRESLVSTPPCGIAVLYVLDSAQWCPIAPTTRPPHDRIRDSARCLRERWCTRQPRRA